MEFYSIFNDVLGPIMYGPSSSHSAAMKKQIYPHFALQRTGGSHFICY